VADDGCGAEAASRALDGMRSRLAEVYEGSPSLPRDRSLQHAVRSFGVERRDFLAVLSGVERDLTPHRYATFDELYRYCFEVAASVGLLCLPVFGRRDALARRHAVDLGIGMQLTNILRDLAEDAARGRIYLPAADLERFGVGEKILMDCAPGSQEQPVELALDGLVRFEAARARRFLQSGRRLFPLLERANRFCPMVMGAIYEELLGGIERLGGRVLRRRVSLSGLRKAWLAARVRAGQLTGGRGGPAANGGGTENGGGNGGSDGAKKSRATLGVEPSTRGLEAAERPQAPSSSPNTPSLYHAPPKNQYFL
jgi:phytoene synthase